MSAIEPVSRPLDLTRGVSVTGGRPLPDVLVRRPEPSLSDEAWELIEAMPRLAESQLDFTEVKTLAQRIGSNPTRAGMEAFAWLGWCCREAARKKYPADAGAELGWALDLENLSKVGTDGLDRRERANAELEKTLKQLVNSAYAEGAKDAIAKLAADASRPTLVREVEFHEDERGHVVGKTEKEYIVREAQK